MFDYLTKPSAINLKESIAESINYLGWESNLSIRPPRFLKYCVEVSVKQTSETDLVERQYIQ